jgi:hypothetical protein
MIKLAMIKVSKAIKKEGFKSKMILQVHDELIFDALRSEAEALKACILENMESALPLPNLVPVIAEAVKFDGSIHVGIASQLKSSKEAVVEPRGVPKNPLFRIAKCFTPAGNAPGTTINSRAAAAVVPGNVSCCNSTKDAVLLTSVIYPTLTVLLAIVANPLNRSLCVFACRLDTGGKIA